MHWFYCVCFCIVIFFVYFLSVAMRLVLALLCLIGLGLAAPSVIPWFSMQRPTKEYSINLMPHIKHLWKQFIDTFKHTSSSSSFANFVSNVVDMHQHNMAYQKKKTTYQMGVNQFTAMVNRISLIRWLYILELHRILQTTWLSIFKKAGWWQHSTFYLSAEFAVCPSSWIFGLEKKRVSLRLIWLSHKWMSLFYCGFIFL